MKKVVVLFCVTLLFSCDLNVVSSDLNTDLKENRWYKDQELSFEIYVNENEDVWFHFRHIYDYILPDVAILVIIKRNGDTAKEKSFTETILIKDENNNELGNCTGDICDVYQKINHNFTSGNYTISFTNQRVANYLPNVIGVGYQIRKKD